jgi:glutamyl-tRNA reductase
MNIVLVGMNHRTAPVTLRERLAFDQSRIPDALSSLVDHETIEEGLIVSTCNRVELLASAIGDPHKGIERLCGFLSNFHGLAPYQLNGHLYHYADYDAIKHVFRVASSLDSMVVGETQILGQVKDAYQHAVRAGTIGRILSQLMDRAIKVARRVRNETAISLNPVSIGSVAVDLILKVFGDLKDKTVMLIGAGEMAELIARNLMESGAGQLIMVNRTTEKAKAIARKFQEGTSAIHASAIGFDALTQLLTSVDIVICSTGATDYVVRRDQVKRALKSRKRGPILFTDISVPRNIDPTISELDNAFVFNIDDLESVAAANLRERQKEAQKAEAIIEAEAQQFIAHMRSLDIGSSVVELKRLLSEMAFAEFKRNRKHLGVLTPQQEAAIKQVLIPALVNKLSHPIIVHLRAAARSGEHSSVLDELRKMFHIDRHESD